jgi:hypothetical protein
MPDPGRSVSGSLFFAKHFWARVSYFGPRRRSKISDLRDHRSIHVFSNRRWQVAGDPPIVGMQDIPPIQRQNRRAVAFKVIQKRLGAELDHAAARQAEARGNSIKAINRFARESEGEGAGSGHGNTVYACIKSRAINLSQK